MGEGAPADDRPIEVEWQFDALDLRPVERWLATLPQRAAELPSLPILTVRSKPPRRLIDRYLDTEDWRVARAGLVLRVRRRGQHEEATMKDDRPAAEDGLRRRLEVTEDLPDGGIAAIGDMGPVGRRVTAVAGTHTLRQVTEIRTRRQPFSLRTANGEVAEVALDETTIVLGAGQRPAHLRRVEVELVPEWAESVRPLVDELRIAAGLTPASRSKFEAGLLAGGLVVPTTPDLGPTDVGQDATVGELAYAVLRIHLAALLAHEPGTRLGEDAEQLHEMRVATRRLRAAMDLFVGVLPARARVLREELRWVADALGTVRDLDVQLARTDEMTAWMAGTPDGTGAVEDLRALLVEERSGARRQLLSSLDSSRWERATAGLVELATRGPNRRVRAARVPAATVVGDLVLDRHRRAVTALRRAKQSDSPSDYHRLRIRCKRLRYSIEVTTAVYGRPARRFAKKLAKLQDALGLLQDDETASERLLALATAPVTAGAASRALSLRTVFVMGAITEHCRLDSEGRRAAMHRQLRALQGSAWDDLAKAVQRRRSASRSSVAAAPPRQAPGTAPPGGSAVG